MVLYRALDNLSIGVVRGAFFDSARLNDKARTVLEGRGRIVPVSYPAISEVWPERVGALFAAGFNCLGELILAPKTIDEPLRTWRDEAILLLSPGKYQGCECRRRRQNAEDDR